jgi:hypothetical protein
MEEEQLKTKIIRWLKSDNDSDYSQRRLPVIDPRKISSEDLDDARVSYYDARRTLDSYVDIGAAPEIVREKARIAMDRLELWRDLAMAVAGQFPDDWQMVADEYEKRNIPLS